VQSLQHIFVLETGVTCSCWFVVGRGQGLNDMETELPPVPCTEIPQDRDELSWHVKKSLKVPALSLLLSLSSACSWQRNSAFHWIWRISRSVSAAAESGAVCSQNSSAAATQRLGSFCSVPCTDTAPAVGNLCCLGPWKAGSVALEKNLH